MGSKEWTDKKYAEDPEWRKKELLMKRYGLTPEDYQQMAVDQKGTCPSCMRFFGYNIGDMDVDHDHETDEVRCLLCRSCNIAEGRALTIWPFLKDELWEHISRNLRLLEKA
jgi:hypothetical protein